MKTEINLSTDFIDMAANSALTDPYWIEQVRISGERRGKYISEHIANGGTVEIRDAETGIWYTVTAQQFADAIGKYIQALYVDEKLCGYLDDATAEMVFQFACFGKVIYG